MKNQFVTTELLGSATISGQGYVNPDDSHMAIDTDFLGNRRSTRNPTPGPFEVRGDGVQKYKVSDFSAAIDKSRM
jgi:hypothetical protein